MTQPTRYLTRMFTFLALVLVVVALLFPSLAQAFAANPMLNGFILCVALGGIAWNVRQVILLRAEVDWLDAFRNPRPATERGIERARPLPRLLAPMASMMAARRSATMSAAAMRSLLDGISSRLDETRELSRYMTGLLIFLGLLGTFWGLLLTIASVADVIGAMSVGDGDVNLLFNQLKAGLAQPLRGMGVAFSSSMLGLAGALVLGFLDLTAGQAQNRFFMELEDWLAGQTRLSSGTLGADAEAGVPAYAHALLEGAAESLEAQARTDAVLGQVAEYLAIIAEQLNANQALLARLAQGQLAASQGAPDEAILAHLRNSEDLLARLLADTAQGRVQSTQEIRSEIRVLTRTIMQLSGGTQAGDAPVG